MKIELLDLTDKIDIASATILAAVNEVARKLELPYIVVGATARDMILHYSYGASIQPQNSRAE